MRTTAAVALSIALVVATVGAVPLVGVAQTTDASTPTTASGGNASTLAPGEQFAGVVGVQAAEVEGEVETRRFEKRVQRASNATERAAIVADATNETGARLAELRERRERLRRAHENGTLSDGQYRARLARLAAEIRTTERVATRTADVTATLPDGALRANGVNRTAVETLRKNASGLDGPEVAEAARSVGGPSATERGPPDDERPGNASDDAADRRNGPPASDDDGDSPGASGDGERPGNAPDEARESNGSGDPANESDSGDGSEDGPETPADDRPADRKAPADNRKDDGRADESNTDERGGENETGTGASDGQNAPSPDGGPDDGEQAGESDEAGPSDGTDDGSDDD
jgi:hypothetical protein